MVKWVEGHDVVRRKETWYGKRALGQIGRRHNRLCLRLVYDAVPTTELSPSIRCEDDYDFFFLYGAAAHIGPWPPLYEVP
jgi:hypothetical protein